MSIKKFSSVGIKDSNKKVSYPISNIDKLTYPLLDIKSMLIISTIQVKWLGSVYSIFSKFIMHAIII